MKVPSLPAQGLESHGQRARRRSRSASTGEMNQALLNAKTLVDKAEGLQPIKVSTSDAAVPRRSWLETLLCQGRWGSLHLTSRCHSNSLVHRSRPAQITADASEYQPKHAGQRWSCGENPQGQYSAPGPTLVFTTRHLARSLTNILEDHVHGMPIDKARNVSSVAANCGR